MKRGSERAARLSSDPDEDICLSRQRHKPLQVRERGDFAAQRRRDLRQRKSLQPPHWGAGLRPEWQEAPHQHPRGWERPSLAHLLGAGGGWAREPEPDLEGPAWRGAASWWPRGWENQRAAVRGEKRRQEDPGRLQPWCTKARRTVVGAERKGAFKATGQPHPAPPLGPPEKNKGKQGPSRKTGGGRCPADPWVNGGLDTRKLSAATGGTSVSRERERDLSRGRRRTVGWTAHLVPGRNNCLRPIPDGRVDSLEPLQPVGSTRGGRASPPGQRWEKSKCRKELELAFEKLFNTHRKLQRHLRLHLQSLTGVGADPKEGQGFSEARGHHSETWTEKTVAASDTELVPDREATRAAQEHAHHAPPRSNLQKLLSKFDDQRYRGMLEPPLKDKGNLSSTEIGTLISEESTSWSSAKSRQELPRLDTLSLRLHPQGQADRAGLVASRLKQDMEQRRQTQLELLEPPKVSLEVLGLTDQGERGEQTRARPARAEASSPRDPGKDGGYGCRPASPPASSSSDYEDDDGGQKIRDIQQQILDQGKLHQQFLEEARKRLREFQR
ncbi:PREDICTED: protein DDC8 homolog [Miniopterus natalensis]|uniref:protein DDC8 homolog n=1 Tax=Miniopterus natalensis TaxID=291302 RepID=UPI0007A6BE12|nr:PREDICTED: protein DDC8 homolog [Miniopterus natalensis]